MSGKFKQSFEEWCLENNHIDILNDFDSKRNNVLPSEVNAQDKENMYWFVCGTCGEKYLAKLYNIFLVKDNRCPNCTIVRKRKAKINIVEGIKENNQEYLLGEWQEDKNGKIDNIEYNSTNEAWWKCHKCNYEWQTKIFVRTVQKCGCPRCAGKVASEENNLRKIFMKHGLWKAFKWWDEEANGCKIEEALPGKRKGHHWRCPECGHRFEKIIGTSHKYGTLILECEICGCAFENGTEIYGKFNPENGPVRIYEPEKNPEVSDYELFEQYVDEFKKILSDDEFYIFIHSVEISDCGGLGEETLARKLMMPKEKVLRLKSSAMRKVKILLNNKKQYYGPYYKETDGPYYEQKLIPLFKTTLPNKIQKVLNENFIYTLNQLTLLTNEEILNIRHIGKKELDKILDVIDDNKKDLEKTYISKPQLLYHKDNNTHDESVGTIQVATIPKVATKQDTEFLTILDIEFLTMLDEILDE